MKKILSFAPTTVLFGALYLLQARFVFAQLGEVDTVFNNISGFIDGVLIPLLFTVALLVFLYGMFNYFIVQGDNETARENGRRLMLWAIIGFVVMVSIWGIVNIIATGLFGPSTPPTIPGTPTL